MTDTTIRRIVWYALLTALFIQAFGLKAQTVIVFLQAQQEDNREGEVR